MKKIVSLLMICIFCIFFLSAENIEPAILARGPVMHHGIEFLGVNAIQAQYGEYKYNDDIIIVYYTTEDVFLSESWTSGDCSLSGVMQKNYGEDRKVVAYTDKKGWTAFLSFETTAEYICSFVSVYRSRQNYFINIAGDKNYFSFPAILEF